MRTMPKPLKAFGLSIFWITQLPEIAVCLFCLAVQSPADVKAESDEHPGFFIFQGFPEPTLTGDSVRGSFKVITDPSTETCVDGTKLGQKKDQIFPAKVSGCVLDLKLVSLNGKGKLHNQYEIIGRTFNVYSVKSLCKIPKGKVIQLKLELLGCGRDGKTITPPAVNCKMKQNAPHHWDMTGFPWRHQACDSRHTWVPSELTKENATKATQRE